MQPETDLTPQPTRELSPLSLYQQALEKGLDPDKLSKLLDLHERIEAKRSEQAYTEAFRRVQERIPVIVKDKNGQNNSYAKLETIQEVLRPILRSEGFTVSTTEADCPKEHHIRVKTTIAHTGGHKTEHFGDFPIDGAGARRWRSHVPAIQETDRASPMPGGVYLLCMIFDIAIAGQDTNGVNPNALIDDLEVLKLNDLITNCPALDAERFYAWVSSVAKRPIKDLKDLPKHCFPIVEKQLLTKKGGGAKTSS